VVLLHTENDIQVLSTDNCQRFKKYIDQIRLPKSY